MQQRQDRGNGHCHQRRRRGGRHRGGRAHLADCRWRAGDPSRDLPVIARRRLRYRGRGRAVFIAVTVAGHDGGHDWSPRTAVVAAHRRLTRTIDAYRLFLQERGGVRRVQ